jgi:hypothetical protein
MSNEDVGTTIGTATIEADTKNGGDEGGEYEEEFEIEIRTQKGSFIKVETTSYNKLDDLLDKAFNNYQRLAREESGNVDEKLQYQ